MTKVTNKAKPLRVAMIAPPWLKVPVKGYGGVEVVMEALIKALVKEGVEVELFGVRGSKIPGVKLHPVTKREEFQNILKPMYEFALSAPCAHVLRSLELIRQDGGFDIIHDHNYFVGPSVLAHASGRDGIPASIHTVHGPPPTPLMQVNDGVADNRNFWRALAGAHNCWLVSISDAMRHSMPRDLESEHNMLDTVYNAVNVEDFPFVDKKGKKNYFMTLGGLTPEKAPHIAAKICAKKRRRLRMAGPVVDMTTTKRVMAEIANPLSKYRNNRNFKYFSDKVLPLILKSRFVSYTGMVSGRQKFKTLSEAKALLHPIEWDEPFGMVIIEALACGTPVVAMNRGAMSEIIQHGVNGFLAENEQEFGDYMDRIDEIDSAACRESVVEKFSAKTMAQGYIERYKQAIELAKKQSKS